MDRTTATFLRDRVQRIANAFETLRTESDRVGIDVPDELTHEQEDTLVLTVLMKSEEFATERDAYKFLQTQF